MVTVTAVQHRGNTKTNKARGLYKNESAVSPVIGTILMVAVTVMLSAGVYVWTSVFSDDAEAPESAAIRATGIDRDGNGLVEYVRLTLVSGNDAPYNPAAVAVQFLPPLGEVSPVLCATPDYNGTTGCATNHTEMEMWDVGESLYIPCQEPGKHMVTLNIRGHMVLDKTMICDEPVA